MLTEAQLEAPGCAWPWLLAARVLRGGPTLRWPELWDVLRWYAHNRGYDGNKGWSKHDSAAPDDDTEKEKQANKLLEEFAAKHGRGGTMAEVFCDKLGLDPLGPVKSSTARIRNLGAAFPREGVEREVEQILRAHIQKLSHFDEPLIEAILRDHTAVAGPNYRMPARYGQRVNGRRTPGGLLFGQLVPRFDNRIIATCPITYQRVRDSVFDKTGDEKYAHREAEKRAKVPGVNCLEFFRFRWAMQVANVTVATDSPGKPRRLSLAERVTINAEMEKRGALTPAEFRKVVRAQTNGARDNLGEMLALPDADKSLVLDRARKLVDGSVLAVLWPSIDPKAQAHTLNNLRRGKAISVRMLLAATPSAEAVFDRWWDGEAMRKPRKGQSAVSRAEVLDRTFKLHPDSGRAPYTREVMREAYCDVFERGIHPSEENGALYRNESVRSAQLQRALDEQTNNQLVRHRLKILERLHADLLREYSGGDSNRVARITIEVNRDLREMSGKTAQEQAKIQGQQMAQFRSVERKLAADYDGLGIRLGPGLIRKARIAEDLGWTCPYTGKKYDSLDLLHRRVDKDHIIPRSQRPSDSLDSLVITFSEVNNWKGTRTAVQFIEEEQGKPVPGMPNSMIKSLTTFQQGVDALETFRGHDDDQRRKRNRKRLLGLRDYVEREFTPGDLTRTSQLVRLGAQLLQKQYFGVENPPTVTSLPGSVTGAVRKSWKLSGCLAVANPSVLNHEDTDEGGNPKVRPKAEIRGVTHLHHALDACVLAYASLFLPRDGGAWELLSKRRLNAGEQRRAREIFGRQVEIASDGELRLTPFPPQLSNEIAERLAERRVVQHLPRDLSGLDSKETVWRVFDSTDKHPSALRLARWLHEKNIQVPLPDAKTALIVCRKRRGDTEGESAGGRVFRETKTWRWVFDIRDKTSLLGLVPDGDPKLAKLKKIKAVKVLGANFGVALEPQPRMIRPHKVWHQLNQIRTENGGRQSPLVRVGSLIDVPNAASRYRGIWMVRGTKLNQKSGILLNISAPDVVPSQGGGRADLKENVSLRTLIRDGMKVLRTPLCGVAATPG